MSRRNQQFVRWGWLLGLALACSVLSAQGQEPFAIEPVVAKASAYLPKSVVDGLDPEGLRLVTDINGLKTTVCEVWWAKTVAGQENSPATRGILYGSIKGGALVGVIHFLPESSEDYREDFRDQKLRPGYFTMRYGQMPDDPKHKDVNPYRDFLLLSPVSVDREPAQILSTDNLLRFSRLASRTTHPAIVSLVPVNEGYKASPVVRTDDAGTCILQSKLHLSRDGKSLQDLALAVILVTPVKDNSGS
jgi:hypothetical protein